eukprot:Skav223152  [mRNA]  locus=scaffold2431:118780:119705:- [translate_table: standard]
MTMCARSSFTTMLLLASATAAPTSRCLMAAEALIQQSPDFSKASITTSHLYKRHLAQHFCEIAGNMTAVELGIYHGYTTSVLANMFRKVIAVDVDTALIETASSNLGRLERNVVFLCMDLMSDDWNKFDSNAVDVVVIDADHTYSGVRRDAESALRHFPNLQWMVFHDTWMEQIERAVGEFERDGILE